MLVIKGLFIMACLIFVCLVIVSCEFTESQLVKEQAITFEQEIAYRQRKENELEGELKRANETIKKLERQLECKEEPKEE
jgi:septal ring factor EnvC (AmiA/AmiB activator)